MLKRHLTLIFKVDDLRKLFFERESANAKYGELATIANNVLMNGRRITRALTLRQRAALGNFGRNTASNPIAGRNAQT
jgi:hypothetical protein